MNEIKSGDLKADPSPFEPLDDEGREVTKSMIDEGFRWFMSLVETRRNIRPRPDPRPGAGPGLHRPGGAGAASWSTRSAARTRPSTGCARARNVDQEPEDRRLEARVGRAAGAFSARSAPLCRGLFGAVLRLGQMLARDATLSTLGLDGLVSVWHPSEN